MYTRERKGKGKEEYLYSPFAPRYTQSAQHLKQLKQHPELFDLFIKAKCECIYVSG